MKQFVRERELKLRLQGDPLASEADVQLLTGQ